MEHKEFKTKRQNGMNHAVPVDFLAVRKSVAAWINKVHVKIRFTLGKL